MPSKSRRKATKSRQSNDSKPKVSRPRRQGLRSSARPAPDVGDDIHTVEPVRSPRIGFLSVPIEVRSMIYYLLLAKDDKVSIESDFVRNPHLPSVTNHITSIVRVNKQISDEALPILYSSQVFRIGNGFRSRHPDDDALKMFIKTVRPHLIASITSLDFNASLDMGLAWFLPGFGLPPLFSGNLAYASSFRSMCQQILKNMTGLKSVTISFGAWGRSINALRMFSRTATVSGFAASIRLLMKLPRLNQIELVDCNILGFQLLLDKLVSGGPGLPGTGSCTVVPISVSDGHPGGLLMTTYLLSW